MDYKNIAMNAKPPTKFSKLSWILVLLSPVIISALLLAFVPNLTPGQQILIILCCLIVLLSAQIYKAYKDNKQSEGKA